MSAEEYARQVLKLELQANEELEDMVDDHSWEEVDDALVDRLCSGPLTFLLLEDVLYSIKIFDQSLNNRIVIQERV